MNRLSKTSNDFNAQIVSPPFPCGVTWLVNALLVLNVKISNSNFGDNWYTENDLSSMKIEASNHLKWHLPILRIRPTFNFQASHHIRWEHRLDFLNDEAIPTIVFLREPLDAIYSLYKRDYQHLLTFDAYIRKSDKWPDHFPELFQVPPLETYIFFVRAWLALHQGEILILKFENYKDNPAKVLKKALNFLAIDRSDKEISEACRLSTHQIAIENVKELEIETGRTFTVARRSKKNEYKETWKLSSQLCISKPSRRFLKNYREGHLDDSLWYHHLKIQNRKKFCSIRNSFDDRLTSLSDFEFVREIETKKLSGLALRENILRRHSSKLNNYMKFSQNDMHQRSLKFFENIVLEFGETQVFTELILKNIRELENYTKVELNKSLGIWYLLIKRLKKTSMNILIRFFIKMEKVEGI